MLTAPMNCPRPHQLGKRLLGQSGGQSQSRDSQGDTEASVDPGQPSISGREGLAGPAGEA